MIPVALSGMGAVTPLGNQVGECLDRLSRGEVAPVCELPAPHAACPAFYHPVPAGAADAIGRRMARIRRSSPITYYSVTAGLAALEDAGEEVTPTGLPPERAARTAVIFAICSGGVQYTRRFYEKIQAEGPSGASPILFPETVYNAPASHLSATLGINGPSYTVVGDGSVGFSALRFAGEVLGTNPSLEQCVVVGAEEADWILWEGYAAWRLLSREPCVRLHQSPPAGMLLSEGATALVVRRASGKPGELLLSSENTTYPARREAARALDFSLSAFAPERVEAVYGSANGTWIDAVEAAALRERFPDATRHDFKGQMGEPLGAGALLQVALGAEAIRRGTATSVLATSLGLNQQAGAAWVRRG